MAYTHGMNVEVVRQIGRDLKAEAANIGTVIHRVDGLVANSSANWHGKDATTFAGWWQQQHRPNLVQLQSHLDGLGKAALANAEEQEIASA